MSLTEDAVREELKKVIDPELFVNIVDLGLIYVVGLADGEDGQTKGVDRHDDDQPDVSGRPAIDRQQQAGRLGAGKGSARSRSKSSWIPPWSPDRMTDDARDKLGIF